MAILKCKMCGGDLNVTADEKIIECEFCGTTQTIPDGNDEKKTNLFNRANRLRIANEFDKAAGIYESIIAEFPDEAESYWGLCLCKFGIEYVDDPKTAKKIPTCHRTSFESIFDDENYKIALENSDVIAQGVYKEEATVIDNLQKDILSIVHKEEPFDVFICYKETDELGQRTQDSVLAQDIYDALADKGFKVFFSRITLEDKLGKQYEPYIFAALNSAKVMLAIGTKEEYYNAVWVKNEWSRYLALMESDKSKMLIPCYRGIDPYDMPQEFKNLQGQDMSKLGFLQDLVRGVSKIINPIKKEMANVNTDTNNSKQVSNKMKPGNYVMIGAVLILCFVMAISFFSNNSNEKSTVENISSSKGSDLIDYQESKPNLDLKYAVWCSDEFEDNHYYKNGEGVLEFETEYPLSDYGVSDFYPDSKFISYAHYSESEIIFRLNNSSTVAIKNPIIKFEFENVFLIPHMEDSEYVYSNFVNGMGYYTNLEWTPTNETIQPGIEKEIRLNMKECPILSDDAFVNITVAADNVVAKNYKIPIKAKIR